MAIDYYVSAITSSLRHWSGAQRKAMILPQHASSAVSSSMLQDKAGDDLMPHHIRYAVAAVTEIH